MRNTMRGSPGASDSALRLGLALTIVLATVLAGCPHAARKPGAARVPERKAPARVLVVRLEQVSLKTSAWVELHSWLAASARASTELGDPDLDAAARAYGAALADDERDEAFTRTARALERCEDERCARAAVTGSPFAAPYLAALPSFSTRHWLDRADVTRGSIDVARAAMAEEEMVEALVTRLAQDLAIDWPVPPPVVAMAGNAPEAGRAALVRPLLGARSTCFAKERKESERVHAARVMDCVLGYAAISLEERSTLAVALGRELSARGKASEVGRAWSALVVHAVAMVVSAWEPKHASVLRRSAVAVMPEALEWLAREWPSRMRGEAPADFAKRYAAAL